MSLFTLTMFVAVVWQIYRRKPAFSFARFSKIVVDRRLAVAAGSLLVVSYAAQLGLTDYQAAHDGVRSAIFRQLPVALVYSNTPYMRFGGIEHDLISLSAAALAVVETAALLVLCLYGKMQSRVTWPYVAIAAALLVLSLAARTLTSSDVLYYTFESTVGLRGYDPPTNFTPEYSLINRYTLLLGTIYGPLWIALNDVVGSFGHTVVQKIFALRVFNVLLLIAALGILRGLKASKAAQVAFALNPMLWFYFVVNAHNDLIAIVPCLASILAVRRSRAAAAVLVAAAGCIKLPFLLIGCLAFSKIPRRSERAVWILNAVALCLAASWIFGGEPYLHHLTGYLHQRSTYNGPIISAAIMLGALGVLAIFAAAIAFDRFYAGAALLVASASPLLYPWYLSWSIPYALAGGVNAAAVLLALPVAATLLDSVYRLDELSFAIFIFVVSACAIDLLRNSKRTRAARVPV